MRFTSLASGSAGNAALISSGKTAILVDCGLCVKDLKSRLKLCGRSLMDITAVLITHEHADHAGGLERFLKARKKQAGYVPVYTTLLTSERFKWQDLEADQREMVFFTAGGAFCIGGIRVQTFNLPHDCADQIGATFEADGQKIGYATDLGYIPEIMKIRFRNATAIFLESNHDTEMLRRGGHPEAVKERVAGDLGHLSNAQVTKYLAEDMGDSVRHLTLGHMSTASNTESAVMAGVAEGLLHRGPHIVPNVLIARQDRPVEIFLERDRAC